MICTKNTAASSTNKWEMEFGIVAGACKIAASSKFFAFNLNSRYRRIRFSPQLGFNFIFGVCPMNNIVPILLIRNLPLLKHRLYPIYHFPCFAKLVSYAITVMFKSVFVFNTKRLIATLAFLKIYFVFTPLKRTFLTLDVFIAHIWHSPLIFNHVNL